MTDRSSCYVYTGKMIEAPTRDENRFKKKVTPDELEKMKNENEELKRRLAELTQIVNRIVERESEEKPKDKKK